MSLKRRQEDEKEPVLKDEPNLAEVKEEPHLVEVKEELKLVEVKEELVEVKEEPVEVKEEPKDLVKEANRKRHASASPTSSLGSTQKKYCDGRGVQGSRRGSFSGNDVECYTC